jgi:hypothetical protein
VHQLGVGREGDRLLLHGGVDDHLREVGGLRRAGAGRDRQALLQQRREPLGAHALPPAGQRGALERQRVLEELLAAEQLEVGVLEPALAQRLVGEVVQMLEDREPGHQPGRQGRPAGILVVDLAKALLEEAPVDRLRELHQCVIGIDDLIEPRPKQIGLAALAPLLGSHESLPGDCLTGRESRPYAWRNLPENVSTAHQKPQIRILAGNQNSHTASALRVLHG